MRLRDQRIAMRVSRERGIGRTLSMRAIAEDSSFDFGVRVIVNGVWEFAASPLVTLEEIARITGDAVIIAKANASIQPKPVQLAPVKAYRDRWLTPHDKGPLMVPMAAKAGLLEQVTDAIRKNTKVFTGSTSLSLCSEDKYFASFEGSPIQQYLIQIYGDGEPDHGRLRRFVAGSDRVGGAGSAGNALVVDPER